MALTIQSSRDNPDSKTIFFTIEYDGEDYKWHGDSPLDADEQEFLDAKSDTLKAEILRKQYPDAVVPHDEYDGKSVLESFEAWIAAGCKNAEVKDEDYAGNEYVITPETVIEKTAWVDSH